MSGPLRLVADYAELGRLSNAPTCITNVLVGSALAVDGRLWPWPTAAAMTIAILFLYVGGMALNDLVDAAIDQHERPQRPIPSGRITQAAAGRFVWVCLTSGLGIIAMIGVVPFLCGLALVAAIVAYDLTHKKFPASVVLMGLCRGLVYLTAAAAVAWPLDWSRAGWSAAAITLYIIILTVVARVEATSVALARFRVALLLPACVLLPFVGVRPEVWTWPAASIVAVVLWIIFSSRHLTAQPPRIGAAVQGWLAGICLIDGLYLAVLDETHLVIVAVACFLLARWGHRFVPGT